MIINRTLTTIANHICKRDMYISEQDMNLSQMYCDVICIGILIQSDYIAPADSAKGTSVTYTGWYRQDFRDFGNQKRCVDFPLDTNYRKNKEKGNRRQTIENQLTVTSRFRSSRKFGGETNNKFITIMEFF